MSIGYKIRDLRQVKEMRILRIIVYIIYIKINHKIFISNFYYIKTAKAIMIS